MKFSLSSLFLVASAVGSVMADEAACKRDVVLITQHQGQKYTPALAAQAESTNIRVIHPGDAVTMDLRPDRLNVNVDDNDIIQKAHCG